MTHEEWMTLLGPLLAALVLAAAGIITTLATGITGRLKAYLDAKGQAEASKVVTDASVRVQTAMANAAGQIALKVQTGALDLTNGAAVLAEAHTQAELVVAKLPDAVELLRPMEGAIAAGILGKLGALAAVQTPIAVQVSPSA